ENKFTVYGDDTYSLTRHIIPPFNEVLMDEVEERTNLPMRRVRRVVETEFRKTVTSLSRRKYGSRILETKPALKYVLVTIFKNIHTCLHRSPFSRLFHLGSPTLETYITV
ncbi:hypothetical protein K501DRAFT_166411, partial [Backusella circina FSU 941]